MENLLSVKEVSKILGVSEDTVRSYIKAKLLKASQMRSNKMRSNKRGRNEYRISPTDIEECLKNAKK